MIDRSKPLGVSSIFVDSKELLMRQAAEAAPAAAAQPAPVQDAESDAKKVVSDIAKSLDKLVPAAHTLGTDILYLVNIANQPQVHPSAVAATEAVKKYAVQLQQVANVINGISNTLQQIQIMVKPLN